MSTTNPRLERLVKNVKLPTLPDVVMRINQLLEDPETGTREIGELVSQDAPLAAKVLKIANSAYYGLSGNCVSTAHASTVLGVRVLKNIVTQAAVMEKFAHLSSSPDFDIQALWIHSIHTARIASELAKRAGATTSLGPDEFYVCGLLHDVGQVVLLDAMGEDYLAIARSARTSSLPMFVAEEQALGFTHSQVGALVATRWGLPEPVEAAIRDHHASEEELLANPVAAVVSAANLVGHTVQEGNPAAAHEVLGGPAAAGLRLDAAAVDAVLELATSQVPAGVE